MSEGPLIPSSQGRAGESLDLSDPLGQNAGPGCFHLRNGDVLTTIVTRAAAVMIIAAHAPVEPGSLLAQLLKNPPAMQETPVQSLAQEDPLEKG